MLSKSESEKKHFSAVNVGHGNYIMAHRIIAILESGPLPVKKLREHASQKGQLVDATAGRKMRSIIITDSGHVILSGLAPQTLQERLQGIRFPNLTQSLIEFQEGEFVS